MLEVDHCHPLYVSRVIQSICALLCPTIYIQYITSHVSHNHATAHLSVVFFVIRLKKPRTLLAGSIVLIRGLVDCATIISTTMNVYANIKFKKYLN